MEPPEDVILLPEEEEELPPPPSQQYLVKKIITQMLLVAGLKMATGIVMRNLVKSINQFDILYPEAFSRVDWKKYQR